MTEVIRESTESFSKGIKEISSAMLGEGASMSQYIQMLTNALFQQQQIQSYGPQQLFPLYHNNPQGYLSQMSHNNPTFPNGSTQSSANNSVESNVSEQSEELKYIHS